MTHTYVTRLPFKLPDDLSQSDSYRIDTYLTVNIATNGPERTDVTVPEDVSRAIQYHVDTCVAACEKAVEQPTRGTPTRPDSEGRKYKLSDARGRLIGMPGMTIYRIQALRDIPVHGVKAGDLGGFVESEANLSQEGDCWISGDPKYWFSEEVCTICQDAHVSGDVKIVGNMVALSNAKISGKGVIDGRSATFSKDACIKRQGDFSVEGTKQLPITIYRTTDSTAAIAGVSYKSESDTFRFNGEHPSHLRKQADIPEFTAEALIQKASALERSWLDEAWLPIIMAGTQGD